MGSWARAAGAAGATACARGVSSSAGTAATRHRPRPERSFTKFRLTGLALADEAYVGGSVSGGQWGRGAPNKAVVTGAVEPRAHSAGSLRLSVVSDASQAELGPFVRGVILPRIHEVASNLETWLRGTFHGVSPKHLPRDLEEFTYRFDRRARETDLFPFVLRRAAGGGPLPDARLTAEGIVFFFARIPSWRPRARRDRLA